MYIRRLYVVAKNIKLVFSCTQQMNMNSNIATCQYSYYRY